MGAAELRPTLPGTVECYEEFAFKKWGGGVAALLNNFLSLNTISHLSSFLSRCKSVLSWSTARTKTPPELLAWPQWHHTGAVISFLCLQSQTAQAALWPHSPFPCSPGFPQAHSGGSNWTQPCDSWLLSTSCKASLLSLQPSMPKTSPFFHAGGPCISPPLSSPSHSGCRLGKVLWFSLLLASPHLVSCWKWRPILSPSLAYLWRHKALSKRLLVFVSQKRNFLKPRRSFLLHFLKNVLPTSILGRVPVTHHPALTWGRQCTQCKLVSP